MKPLPSLRFLLPLLACLSGLLLCSCGPRETLVEQGNREQILHRAIGHELGDLDPHLATQTIDYHVLSALFEGLVAEDPVDLHPVPGVAESWKISDDGLIYTFHLRSNARWSNGDPVTAQDFLASFKRALSPSLGAENASQLYVVKGAEAFNKGSETDFSKVGFEAPDAHTLIIRLENPASYFLPMLNQSIWFPVHVASIAKLGPVDRRGTPWTRTENFVSNGAFRLKEWSINHRIIVERSPLYWDAAKIRLTQIHFYPNGIDSQERSFRAGQLHVTDALLPSKIDHYLSKSPELLRLDPWLGTYFLRINTRLPLLADPKLRKALSLAIDRDAIVNRVLRGAATVAHSFTPPGMSGYEEPGLVRSDAEEARAWLSEAGYPGGKGLPALELTLNSSDLHRQVAEAIQEMWRRELGIELKLVIMENRSVLAARRSGDYQILVSTWTGDYADPRNFLEIWSKDSGNNFTGWSDSAFESLFAQSTKTQDVEKRYTLLAASENILLEAAPCIPIYHFKHAYLLQPSVHGWNKNLLDHHPYKGVWLEMR